MYSPIEPTFWLLFLYFLLAMTLAFYVPGNLFIRKLNLNNFNQAVLSIIFGMVLWSLQGFFFGYLGIRFVTYIYLTICLILWIKFDYFKIFKKIKLRKPDWLTGLIIFFGTIIQLSSVWFNGIKFKDGLYFCCGVPDTLFHLALSNELVKQFPPMEPGINGVFLKNYHFFSNLNTAELVRIFNLPLVNTQYQFMTVLLSGLLGLSAVVLSDILGLNKHFKRWFVFLLFFSGDIIFLLSFLFGKGINFTYTTLENASSLWISPSRFYSIIIFIAGLSILVVWLKKRSILAGIVMAIIFGSLIGFKVYVGGIALAGFAVLGLIFLVKRKISNLFPIILFFLISLAIYLPVNVNAGGLMFSGFWRFEDFVSQPSLGMSQFELARRIYLDHHNFLRVLSFDLFFGILYVVFSAGALCLGIFQTKKSLTKIPKELNIFLLFGLISTSVLGFFFIQKTGGANSSQFLISIYIIGAFYAALAISFWTLKLNLKIMVPIVIILILAVSTRVVHDSFFRISRIIEREGSFVNNDTLNSYKFFNNTEKNSIVLTYNDYGLDCIFIPFIGNRITYSCKSGAPEDRGLNLLKKEDVQKIIFYSSNINESKMALKLNDISYIYLPADKVKITNIVKMNLKKVFENKSAVIYKTGN